MTKPTSTSKIFRPTAKKSITETLFGRDEVWATPTLGGSPRRLASSVVPASDGVSIFYNKIDSPGLFRATKSQLIEELVYNSEGTGLYMFPLLLFPGDNDLLAAGVRGEDFFDLPFVQNKREQS